MRLLRLASLAMLCLGAPGYADSVLLDIPPRLQWEGNFGYCGEVSLISAGLYYGQYLSQYDARHLATPAVPQNSVDSQLLLGVNDTAAADAMHLASVPWSNPAESPTANQAPEFLHWVKAMLRQGFPVIIGIYMNEGLFHQNPDPAAGDSVYDHIVPVVGIRSHYPMGDDQFHGDDEIVFSDNGLWPENEPTHPYFFSYAFGSFPLNRAEANLGNAIYSLSRETPNFGLAITGVKDADKETLPVRLEASEMAEPAIQDGQDRRPDPILLTLRIHVSRVIPGVAYRLYRYNAISAVPDSHFNQNAARATEMQEFEIEWGDSFSVTERISSDEAAIYRAVPLDAP